MTCPENPSVRPQYDVPLPDRMRGLPRDHRGFVIPYFVAWLRDGNEVNPGDGEPDFRILSPARMARCIRLDLCWLCGQKLGTRKVFAIGPMCAATRTTMEPPGHYECAVYSVKVCPFLSRPKMVRNEKDMPEGHWAPGLTIKRNPGVTALWVTRSYKRFSAAAAGAGKGTLITVGEPERVEWYAQGRPATRAEVEESIESGLPILRETADKQSPEARRDLEEHYLPRLNTVLPT
jgi:hypothetical protein